MARIYYISKYLQYSDTEKCERLLRPQTWHYEVFQVKDCFLNVNICVIFSVFMLDAHFINEAHRLQTKGMVPLDF